MNGFEQFLIIIAALLVLSVTASKASSRFGIPALLLFLAIGLGAGEHGLGGIAFTDFESTQKLGVFALIFILFSGGMDTKMASVRPVLKPALILSTLGVVIASGLIAFFARQFMGFTLLEGFLLGATVASTDVAAVFAALRSKSVSLKEGISPLLELESALNDPMAVFLGVALLGLATQSHQMVLSLVPTFLQQIILGTVIGWASGKAIAVIINKIKLEYDGLYPVLSVGWIILTYAVTQKVGGSGFLAVYIAAIVLGNENLLHRKSLIHFHEGVAWLGQIGMFLAMGLLIDPRQLLQIAPIGIALSVFLVFIARPVSVFICLPFSRFSNHEKLMISWGGLRGAVPIILASYVLASRIPRATDIFNLVFFVTCFSVLLQGTTISSVAKWLKVESPFKEKFRFPIELNQTKNLKNKLVEIPVPTKAQGIGKSLIELDLPKDVLVVLIQRDGDIVVPRGGTHLVENDTLLVLCESTTPEEIKRKVISIPL